LYGNIALDVFKLNRVRRVRRLGRFVNQSENPLRGGKRGLQLADDVGGFVNRPGELARVETKEETFPKFILPER
jgi:hypothetical protein